MTCDCIERVNNHLKPSNTEILLPLAHPSGNRPFIETVKIDSAKRGRPTKVLATFCPFCGVKYND